MIKAGRFDTVEMCDDDEITRIGLASLYQKKAKWSRHLPGFLAVGQTGRRVITQRPVASTQSPRLRDSHPHRNPGKDRHPGVSLLDARRNPAIVQAHGNHENIVDRKTARAIQRIAHFSLKASTLLHRTGRKASDEKIRARNGIFRSGAASSCPGKQLSPIQPRRIASRPQNQEKPSCRCRNVFGGVSDEDAHPA